MASECLHCGFQDPYRPSNSKARSKRVETIIAKITIKFNKKLNEEKKVTDLLHKEVKLLRNEIDVSRNVLKMLRQQLKNTEKVASGEIQQLMSEVSNLTFINNEVTLANTVLLARLEEYEAKYKIQQAE